MTPDEVVSVIEKALKQVAYYNKMTACMHRTHQEDMEDAFTCAITLIQDYQALRERIDVDELSFLIYKHETGLGEELARANWTAKHFQDKSKRNSTPLAQAIVTYLQQPTEH